ncbi:MAG: hypothetical protein RIQ60_169 [Pseudomonadota bacterium]|jgi:uncharacterized protein with NRDE domain
MCLAAFALDSHADFPLILAANRDEYFERPSAPLGWWTAEPDPTAGRAVAAVTLLAGRDLRGGGTWLGLDRRGRLALLTNIRNGRAGQARPGAPSRGEIVPAWLGGDALASAAALHQHMLARGHDDYNLITADLSALPEHTARWHWSSSATRQTLPVVTTSPAGGSVGHVFGLSNGRLDEPWPKLLRLRLSLVEVIDAIDTAKASSKPGGGPGVPALAARLLDALADDRRVDDDRRLPATGVPLEIERMLSSVFIRSDDGRYGTRCSTVIVVQRGVGAHVFERSYDARGQVSGQVALTLPGWPGSAG